MQLITKPKNMTIWEHIKKTYLKRNNLRFITEKHQIDKIKLPFFDQKGKIDVQSMLYQMVKNSNYTFEESFLPKDTTKIIYQRTETTNIPCDIFKFKKDYTEYLLIIIGNTKNAILIDNYNTWYNTKCIYTGICDIIIQLKLETATNDENQGIIYIDELSKEGKEYPEIPFNLSEVDVTNDHSIQKFLKEKAPQALGTHFIVTELTD